MSTTVTVTPATSQVFLAKRSDVSLRLALGLGLGLVAVLLLLVGFVFLVVGFYLGYRRKKGSSYLGHWRNNYTLPEPNFPWSVPPAPQAPPRHVRFAEQTPPGFQPVSSFPPMPPTIPSGPVLVPPVVPRPETPTVFVPPAVPDTPPRPSVPPIIPRRHKGDAPERHAWGVPSHMRPSPSAPQSLFHSTYSSMMGPRTASPHITPPDLRPGGISLPGHGDTPFPPTHPHSVPPHSPWHSPVEAKDGIRGPDARDVVVGPSPIVVPRPPILMNSGEARPPTPTLPSPLEEIDAFATFKLKTPRTSPEDKPVPLIPPGPVATSQNIIGVNVAPTILANTGDDETSGTSVDSVGTNSALDPPPAAASPNEVGVNAVSTPAVEDAAPETKDVTRASESSNSSTDLPSSAASANENGVKFVSTAPSGEPRRRWG